MNRFFLTLTVIVFYGFSSNNNNTICQDRKQVFQMVNCGQEIKDNNTYKKFINVGENISYYDPMQPFIQVSIGKYAIKKGELNKAIECFCDALDLYYHYEEQEEIISSFPKIMQEEFSKGKNEESNQKNIENILTEVYSIKNVK